MAPQVEQYATALGGGARLPPRGVGLRLGSPALEARLVAEDLTQLALGEEAAERQLLAVPAPVLEDGEAAAGT